MRETGWNFKIIVRNFRLLTPALSAFEAEREKRRRRSPPQPFNFGFPISDFGFETQGFIRASRHMVGVLSCPKVLADCHLMSPLVF